MTAVPKPPKYIKPNRATARDLTVSTELNAVLEAGGLWSFDPPARTIACFQKGLVCCATSNPSVFVISPLNYTSKAAAMRRLRAAQRVLEDAGYDLTRHGAWLLVRMVNA